VALTLLAIYPGPAALYDLLAQPLVAHLPKGANSIVQGIGPAWTLCIEVSFYLVLPFLAAAIARLRPSVAGEIGILLGLAVVVIVFRWVIQGYTPPFSDWRVLHNTLLSYFDWFAYGMVLAVLSVAWHGREAGSPVLVTIIRRPWVPWAAALAGVAAVIGHIFPVYAGFRGGRGVATAFGAFLAVSPLAALVVVTFSIAILAIFRYASLMSVIGVFVGFLAVVLLVRLEQLDAPYLWFGLFMLAVEISHVGNIRRLLAGTEPKLGQGGGQRLDIGAALRRFVFDDQDLHAPDRNRENWANAESNTCRSKG